MLAFPKTLLNFQDMFPTEQSCAEYVLAVRWPDGVFCPACGAVEVNEYTDRGGRTRTRPGRIRIEPLRDYGKSTIQDFITRNIEPGSLLRTDGNPSYPGLPGYRHEEFVVGSMAAHLVLPWSHRVISLLKRLGMGPCHGLRRRYIQRYLDEFVWRFNRRKARPATFHKILGLAIQAPPASLGAIMADPADDPNRLLKPDDPVRSTPPGSMLGQLYTRRPKGKGTQPKRK